MPACPTGTLQQQVMQQYSYLFQMAQQLNLALEQLEQAGGGVRPAYASAAGAAGSTKQTEADRQYQKLRTMIVKTADQVRRTAEELTARLEEEYVAVSDFGSHVAALSAYLEANPEAVTQYYSFFSDLKADVAAVDAAFQHYKVDTEGYIRTGIVYYDGAMPVYGVAVGQDLTCREVDGEQLVEQNNFRAVFTATRLSFWQDATEVAYVSNNRLHTVTGSAIKVYAYRQPVIADSGVTRCDADGVPADDGAYLKVWCKASCADVESRNTVKVRARYRPMGGDWSGYTTLSSGVKKLLGGGLAATASYEVELSAVDTVGSVRTVRYTASTSQVTLHLRNGGKGAAFGKYGEREALECAWPAVFYGDAEVAGELTLGGRPLADVLWPVGSVRFTAEAVPPQPSPENAVWESAATGIEGLYAWRRTT